MEKVMPVHGGISSSIVIPSIVTIAIVILMLLLLIILLLIACKFKPWRRFLSSTSSARRRSGSLITVDDIERPLVSGDLGVVENQGNESTKSYSIVGTAGQSQRNFHSSPSITLGHEQRLPSSPQLRHSDCFILDIPNTSEDSLACQTLKRPLAANQLIEERIYDKREDINYSLKVAERDTHRKFVSSDSSNQRSILMLEVISGPSQGLHYSIESTNTSKLPVTIGRVSPGDILLKDTEISGKHAMINWNVNKLKWELVDMGSLNGTLLNSQAVHHPQPGSRRWANPVDLSSGDTITLGTSSKIFVNITTQTDSQIPFGIGVASDPMTLRRGAKKLPMEDVCYYQWPLPGTDQFGLFGICDGHGGADAATSVSKMMPEVITGILSDSIRREKVLSQHDASDVLREAFSQTEARINHYYEGCTATVLLVWADGPENFYAQCANVGDSACVVNIDGKQIKMTEDHRIANNSERLRFQALGAPMREGETRLCGINLARMLGDKFLKEQDARFSSEPYISEVVCIHHMSQGFALLASDGFWDVMNFKKAVQLVHQAIEKNTIKGDAFAEKIANFLLNEARTLRTKDNTSIIFLDFNNIDTNYSCKLDS